MRLELLTMSKYLQQFRDDFLNANTWGQRKDGVPLDLLDKLSEAELKIAENELIGKLSLGDDWPIQGLGHIGSQKALPLLYELLSKSQKTMRVTIAHSIFQIKQDRAMIEIVLEEMPKLEHWTEIIHLLYLLPTFQDERINTLLDNYRKHNDYLVAYNATQVMGLSTEEVVKKHRK